MEIEKEQKRKKKIEEKELLIRTLAGNEVNRMKRQREAEQERKEDIRSMQEYARVLEKQEQDRADYFAKIERNANEFSMKAAQTVIKENDEKMKADEATMNKYEQEKELRLQEKERLQKIQDWENKLKMRKFYDMQLEDKMMLKEFEKDMDKDQARIWNMDVSCMKEQELTNKIRDRWENLGNAEFLKFQLEDRRRKNKEKMTDTEYAMNKETLERIHAISKGECPMN